MNSPTMNDPQRLDEYRWQLLTARKLVPSPLFFYGVITTGIVCRAGCPSRLPKRDNVRFYACCEDAIQAGFRPCKRCSPLQSSPPGAELVIRVCRWIDEHPDRADLDSLAGALGYTSAHLQKAFVQRTGISPHEYAKGLRQQRVYQALDHHNSTSDLMYQVGYRSNSHFYDEFKQFSSLPPGRHRQSGKGEVLTFAVADTPLGALVIAASQKGLCWISLGDDPAEQVDNLQRHFHSAEFCPPDAAFNAWVSKVVGLISDPSQGLDLPLDIRGTVFQRQVWEALRRIPAGSTMDYQTLAEHIGRPGAARAVASACAANVLAVVIPCHRIIRRDGSLSGYRWGVDRKATLLSRESDSPAADQSE